jgi:hypothetical protein
MSRSKRARPAVRPNERALLARGQQQPQALRQQPAKGSRKARRARDPRIELAWRRAAVARRAFGIVAIVGFGAAMALARVTYAGHPKQAARRLSAPASFVQIVRKNQLQAGIVAPAQAPPGAATAVT